MHGQTHCLFFSLPASPSNSLSLLFFSGWPCADGPAVLFLTSTHDCSEETVKSTCTLPCRDLPALCAGPGDAGIVQSDLSYKSVSTLVHDYCLVTGQSALLKVVDWFVNRRLKQTWTQRNNLGLVFFCIYLRTSWNGKHTCIPTHEFMCPINTGAVRTYKTITGMIYHVSLSTPAVAHIHLFQSYHSHMLQPAPHTPAH